ncbi:bifunctional 4-hydroxy-2-oxoglutarate aldolase/2-dehydro-3-deoxy-phosphogluconate aldolase [Seonamhaeicola maritimus]|uniref:bifunctional 4-hydroxy-2-oxoglutarate aldolase/2-dehydro-3-deoxy-phosphogluconate aldolase n=1 Tax=Seonamhaeicola maritimus TaxID=2591822 RepID=UPI0024947450|nr:bifunctional 4-hydroxy-2-oxoglutarate aldolase/2-dehydro-3-deoxy-phosphogluconate aldolase [Seonamhaeicola maritimus]
MNRETIVEIVEQEKLVVVIRLQHQNEVAGVIKNLVESGIKILEVTSNTPGFAEEISKARELYPNVLIGAGTVINSKIAEVASNAGAQFLVTPNTNAEVIEVAHNNDIPVLMGAMTPTEVCNAAEAGADFVKLFPADIMGVDYFKSIKAPLNHVKLLAVGGIDLDTVGDWLAAGAAGIGIGGALTKSVTSKAELEAVKKRATQFIAEVKKYE